MVRSADSGLKTQVPDERKRKSERDMLSRSSNSSNGDTNRRAKSAVKY